MDAAPPPCRSQVAQTRTDSSHRDACGRTISLRTQIRRCAGHVASTRRRQPAAAFADPDKDEDEAWVDITGPRALQTLMNSRLAASGLHVDVPAGVTDPGEMTRILSEQIRQQQAQQQQ